MSEFEPLASDMLLHPFQDLLATCQVDFLVDSFLGALVLY
jgi:hypothetical protein